MPYEWPHEVHSYSNLSIGVSSGVSYPPLAIMLDTSKMEVGVAGRANLRLFLFSKMLNVGDSIICQYGLVSRHGLSLGEL